MFVCIKKLIRYCDFVLKIGLGLVELFRPSDHETLSSLSLLSSPSEGASCLLILLVEGDLTLSVLLTTVNNFAAIGKHLRFKRHIIQFVHRSNEVERCNDMM